MTMNGQKVSAKSSSGGLPGQFSLIDALCVIGWGMAARPLQDSSRKKSRRPRRAPAGPARTGTT